MEQDSTAASSIVALIPENDITSADGVRPDSMMHAAPLHLLKFNYDATTPLVSISLSIHPMPTSDAEGKPTISDEEIKLVYSGIHEGGFNQIFILPAQAALDLSEAFATIPLQVPNESVLTIDNDGKSAANVNTSGVARESRSEDTNRSSLEHTMGNLQVAGATQPDLATVPELSTSAEAEPQTEQRLPRRFGIFPRRQREPDVEEAQQIEMANRAAETLAPKLETEVKEPEKGMRLLIKIEAVGPEGKSYVATLVPSKSTRRPSSQAPKRPAHTHPHQRHVGSRCKLGCPGWTRRKASLGRQSCPP